MNFMEFACRGIVRNEDNIRWLNKHAVKLTKCVRNLNSSMGCVLVAGLMLASVIYANAKDIELLKKQNKDLAREVEELKNQKGA